MSAFSKDRNQSGTEDGTANELNLTFVIHYSIVGVECDLFVGITGKLNPIKFLLQYENNLNIIFRFQHQYNAFRILQKSWKFNIGANAEVCLYNYQTINSSFH